MAHYQPIRILLIGDGKDDYAFTRSALAIIAGYSFEITCVADYPAGLDLIERRQHDVGLIDDRRGRHEVLEFLRVATERGARMPLILLTEQADLALNMAAIRAGAADYLVKNQLSTSALVRAIWHALDLARTSQALRASQERYALAARGSNDGLWDWDVLRSRIYFSPRWKAILGCEAQEIGDHAGDGFSLAHPEDLEQLKQAIAKHLRGDTPYLEVEHRMRHKDGSYRWMLTRGVALWSADGRPYRIAGSLTDITARKIAEERLERSALYDGLTGLPNRMMLMDRMQRALERAKRHADYQFGVLFLDFDRFKVVNDSLGHMIGDQLLIGIAQRLASCVRTEDTVARLGGDEFVVLIDYIADPGDAIQVAERIQRALGDPFDLSGHEVFTTVSIGIALSVTGYEEPETVLRDADIAMYRAKSGGRARYELFDSQMHARAVALLRLETDLRRAIEREEFEIHYQPIVALEGGSVIGFEALVRWRHPQRGLVSPGEFLPVAEETGLIAQIDWWVLQRACRQLAAWQALFPADPPLSMSVNLSSRDFSRPDLADRIESELRAVALEGHSLRLEITESAIMEQSEVAAAMFERLQALGVQVYIDDFGTGYSSLSYLHRFPVATLKIDRSFVSRMGNNGENAKIIQTIVMLARDLGMNVIAEGVETVEQCDRLRALRCEYAQGFFFSRPLDNAAAEDLLIEQHVGA
ncbi:MAG TPA: EAL domain-containing protein [Roseiflexaceae bacterium]|nr:EAL domain-containing protein [Roseiflexaceae bacterium]